MIMNSHLLMSRILYEFCRKKLDFKLDKFRFMYGNIKPDFCPEEIKTEHNYNVSSVDLIKLSKELAEKKISTKEYSLALGVLCHFTCDYFCLYHQESKEKKGMLEHMWYETRLHFVLLKLYTLRKIDIKTRVSIDVGGNLLYNQKKYLREDESFTKDINYALSAAAGLLEYMLCYSDALIYPKTYKKTEEFIKAAGGLI